MKKPIHRFAFLLWVVAGAFVLIEIVLLFALPRGRVVDPNVILFNTWLTIRSMVATSLELASLGLLVEMVDQIRWRGLSPEERARTAPSSSLISTLRQWPNKPDG
jgi:hypothetical protein